MKLAKYLADQKLTYEEFAKATGYTVFSVGKWARQQRLPRPDAMRKIAEATGGAVTANDFNDVAVSEPATADLAAA